MRLFCSFARTIVLNINHEYFAVVCNGWCVEYNNDYYCRGLLPSNNVDRFVDRLCRKCGDVWITQTYIVVIDQLPGDEL